MINLQKINIEDFNNNESQILFEEENSNNCFALVANQFYSFKLAWHSDLLMPNLVHIDDDIYSIGIDQHFSIINFKNGKILCQLNLDYNFIEVRMFENWIFVISELEIIRIDRNTFLLEKQYYLPDIFEDFFLNENTIEVKCFESDIISFKN